MSLVDHSESKEPKNYFIIPGNPPAGHFYKLWGDEILSHSALVRVRISHYPKLARTKDSDVFMKNVLASHKEQLIEFHKICRGPITLIGHSLGGYFSLKLLEETGELIEQAFLLHPFLRSPQQKGRLILKMVGALQEQDLFQRELIKKRKFLELFSKDLSFVTDAEIENTFQIAKHEWNIIGRDESPVFIPPDLRGKVVVFYHQNDTWCSPKVVEGLRQQVVILSCSEPHGFITNSQYRDTLLRKII